MGLWDTITGRRQPPQPKLDELFGLPTAALTLQASLNFAPTGRGAICFQGAAGPAMDDTVKQVVPQLNADGKIDRAWLGVSTTDAAPRDGALVGEVIGGPAHKAGIRAGDLILSFDGHAVKTASDLSQAVIQRKPGDTVKVEVQRDGRHETLTVTLGTRPTEAQQG